MRSSRAEKRLLVLGGGIIGLEMAAVYHALGVKVTILKKRDLCRRRSGCPFAMAYDKAAPLAHIATGPALSALRH